MNSLTIAMAQINTRVGALQENADKISEYALRAAHQGAAVVIFPELALSGYAPEDLILKPHFVEDCEKQLQALRNELPVTTICIVGVPQRWQGKTFNSAAIFADGEIKGFYQKRLLPNYGVFDEKRIFAAGNRPVIIAGGANKLGIHICEDSWHPQALPTTSLKNSGINVLLNLSASPYHSGKLQEREAVLRKTATNLNAYLLYSNLVGGQDELVFDGASMAFSNQGKIIARGAQFREGLIYVDIPEVKNVVSNSSLPGSDKAVHIVPIGLDRKQPPEVSPHQVSNDITDSMDNLEEVYNALTLGLRDYVDKNCFKKVVVALSGGIDSALVAALAVDALGSNRVIGITMPSQYSSEGTLSDAGELAKNLNIRFYTVPIKKLFQNYLTELTPLWEGKESDITEENLQARIRGNIVMAFSNKMRWLVLATGNKSEFAMGYATLYGDMCGGFAVIKDIPKTLIFELSKWRNRQVGGPVIPPSTIERPPSAELRPDQKDTDSLPPYEVLDPILEAYIERNQVLDEPGVDCNIVRQVVQLVDRNEYKRRQAPPGIKISPRAFGKDRRIPITNAYREQVEPKVIVPKEEAIV